MVRKVFSGILIIIILIGVSGCMIGQKKLSPKEQVEKYMMDKYNEKIEIIGGIESYNSSGEKIFVSTEKFPDARVIIRRGKKSGGMIDNYMGFLMKDKVEKAMNDIASEVYPKSKVYYSTDGAPLDGTSPKMGVDEYIKYTGKYIALSVTICVSDTDYKKNKDQKLEQLRLKFEEKQYNPAFRIIYVSDENVDVDPQIVRDSTILKSSLTYGDFSMDESFKLDYSKWKETKK